MKRIYVTCAFLLLLCGLYLSTDTVQASGTEELAGELSDRIEQVFDYKMKENKVEDIQDLVDQVFTKAPSSGVTENYILSLRGFYQGIDYAKYVEALTTTLGEQEQWKDILPASLQKHTLVYSAVSKSNPLSSYVYSNTLGSDGIMSYVYGLLLFTANTDMTNEDSNNLVEGLLNYQLEDGGFALTGESGDVDVTSFVLQALAPYKDVNEGASQATDKALSFLSSAQLPDGDFIGFGAASSESTAQVLLALSALSIDYKTDDRFNKNGNNALEGLLRYQLKDGSFAHTLGGNSDDMATAQSLSALTAVYRYELGQCFLYSYGQEGYDINSVKSKSDGCISYQWILTAILLVLALLYSVLFARKNKKRLLTTAVITALMLLAVWFIRIQSVEEYYNSNRQAEVKKPVTVSISIRCDTVAGKADFIPKDGIILQNQSVTVEEGDSVFDVLAKVTAENEMSMEYKDSNYIEGIQYLYERDYGNTSGWMYQVNGSFTGVGCGEYKVSEGDVIKWLYSVNLGKDVGD